MPYFETIPKKKLLEITAKGNEVRQLKVANRNALIKQEYAQGYMPRILANRHDLSLRQIYRIIK